MSTLLPFLFMFLFLAAIIELSLPIVEAIQRRHARRPWRGIYKVFDNPPKPGETVTVKAPDYKCGEFRVPCTFTVSREKDRPVFRHYRLDIGDLESYEFTDLDVGGWDHVQYLREKIYEGNY